MRSLGKCDIYHHDGLIHFSRCLAMAGARGDSGNLMGPFASQVGTVKYQVLSILTVTSVVGIPLIQSLVCFKPPPKVRACGGGPRL